MGNPTPNHAKQTQCSLQTYTQAQNLPQTLIITSDKCNRGSISQQTNHKAKLIGIQEDVGPDKGTFKLDCMKESNQNMSSYRCFMKCTQLGCFNAF